MSFALAVSRARELRRACAQLVAVETCSLFSFFFFGDAISSHMIEIAQDNPKAHSVFPTAGVWTWFAKFDAVAPTLPAIRGATNC